MDKKTRWILIGVGIVFVLLIAFVAVYKMGSSDGKKQQQAQAQGTQGAVAKFNNKMEKLKLQQNTTVYVCTYQDNTTQLNKVYPVIHKSKDCPDMKNDKPDGSHVGYIGMTYWNLIHTYTDTKFTFCSEWTKDEIAALEDGEK